MDHFLYRNGVLCAEDVPIPLIAKDVGTPFYLYSTATLERHYRVFERAIHDLKPLICYAVKANGNLAVIRVLSRLGAGADVVSGGELMAALAAGVEPDRIVFSGVGKTRDELAMALSSGVYRINVESEPELDALSSVANSLDVEAKVAIRINPDIDAGTHAKVTTGRADNKFGIDWPQTPGIYARSASLPGIVPVGLAVHIGSQITDFTAFDAAFRKLAALANSLLADGYRIESLDVGGGLGIPYGVEGEAMPEPEHYGQVVRDALGGLVRRGVRLVFEPGRVLVGNAGVLVSRVLYVKQGGARTFVIVDAAMNDLARPAMYGAYHAIVPVVEPSADAQLVEVDVVGPICETGDTFAHGRRLPPVGAGDLVAFRSAGGYGATMASMYNLRSLVPEVLVKGGATAIVRERIQFEDLMARQRIPLWLNDEAPAADLGQSSTGPVGATA